MKKAKILCSNQTAIIKDGIQIGSFSLPWTTEANNMKEEFTEYEKDILRPYMSNLNDNVFVLKNLPEVVKGALFSRYSRSENSLRRTLLEEFLKAELHDVTDVNQNTHEVVNKGKAERFYEKVLLQYGDDSVAELAGAHIALEDISIIATKILEDARIGLSPLEKSTRYVYFDQKKDGAYRYHRDPVIMNSRFSEEYIETCDMLFETYSSLIETLSEHFRDKMPTDHGLSERALNATIRAKTCDTLRGLLPASTLTNMGFFGNGRAYEYLITKMYAEPLKEMNTLASKMQKELRTVIPSFVKRPDSEHGRMMRVHMRKMMGALVNKASDIPSDTRCEHVKLLDYDTDAEKKAIAGSLYPYVNASFEELKTFVERMDDEEKRRIIHLANGERKNRRHKPGRGFEHPYYTFEICTNFGAYRDLHRHRMLTQQRQVLGCGLGYVVPAEIEKAGFSENYGKALEEAKKTWESISKDHPLEAQYVVPLAYKIRWEMKINLRSAYHLCELRSARQGHVDYRRIAQKIYQQIKEVHPSLASGMGFMDLKNHDFERAEAEKRIDRKLERSG